MAGQTINESQRRLMAAKRAAERGIHIPSVGNMDRRLEREASDIEWLRGYFPDVFYNPFTAHQIRMVEDCQDAIRYGTTKAKAAPRGDGKSGIVRYLALKYVLTRHLSFPLIIAATSTKARKTLNAIKRRMASGQPSEFQEDYPLECSVAHYVHSWPSRCRNACSDDGQKINVEWNQDSIILPTWEYREPLGPILMALGWTSDEIQGCNIYDVRPDFVILDDLDSRDSLAAENGVIADKIEEVIDKNVGGLGGQSRQLGQYFICTIPSRKSAAYKYTDPIQKPAWAGERTAAIEKWPDRKDLWEDYIGQRQAAMMPDEKTGRPRDPHGRKAFQFYAEHQAEMDAGAVLSNPHNYETTKMPDGGPKHLSALQKCYDFIADKGLEAFETEYQNDPPESTGIMESGITPYRIQRQVSGVPRRQIPEGCTILSQGIDVRKIALHWVVRAWRPEESGAWTGFTVDYGVTETNAQPKATDAAVDAAIIRALHDRREYVVDNPYQLSDGTAIEIDYSLIDSGWRTEAIYQFCDQAGLGWYPAQGHGKSSGCAQVSFRAPTQSTPVKLIGWAYYLASRPGIDGAAWLVHMDADHWKAWEHDRWMSDPQKPGGLFMWGETSGNPDRMSIDERAHHSFARHICAEIEVEEPDKNGVMKRYWKAKSDNNHWLDASYRCDVAAAMAGVRLFGMPIPEPDEEEGEDEGPIIDFGR